jgi:hypothetical protein
MRPQGAGLAAVAGQEAGLVAADRGQGAGIRGDRHRPGDDAPVAQIEQRLAGRIGGGGGGGRAS